MRMLFLLAACALWQSRAQTTPSPLKDSMSSFDDILRVTNVRLTQPGPGSTRVPVEVDVLRLSRQPVTAYGLVFSVKYADGAEAQTEAATDLIESLVPELASDRSFVKSGRDHATFYVPADKDGAPPVSVSAAVVWTAFDDRSVAGHGEAQSLQRVLDARKAHNAYLVDLLSELREIERQPDIAAELARKDQIPGENSARVQKAFADRKAIAPNARRQGFSDRRGSDLDAFAAAARYGRAAFDRRLQVYAHLQSVLEDHSTLREKK
jgi:hypothetical protein